MLEVERGHLDTQGYLISCFKGNCPLWSQGRRGLTCFGTLGKTSMAQNPFRPKRECKKLYSTYNLTDESWEPKMGGVALDYLEISVRGSLRSSW